MRGYYGGRYWFCDCDCGGWVVVRGDHLKSGETQSCGCLQRTKSAERIAARNTTHGMTHDPIYHTWSRIKNRCYNPNNPAYPNYGGRGIKMFKGWINNFEAFYNYVSKLENYGRAGYSLDRINNDGNYEPGNLRFATKKEQARNRRNNIIIEYRGRLMTLAEAAELSGINYVALKRRYHRGDRGADLFRTV